MLNRIVSVRFLVALSIIMNVAGSSSNLLLNASTVDMLPIFLFESMYESILRKCDLPLPKKPEIHTPISAVGVINESS